MKVLVTGAPGWLGNRLVQELVKSKYKVRCLVLPALDASELRALNAEVVTGDLTTGTGLADAVKGADIVFHCAGLIHPKRIKQLYDLNYAGTRRILDESIKAKVKKFIFVSSNSPAGINISRDALFRESDPYNPYKNYGMSKKLAEDYVNKMSKEKKISTTIIRPCWFYGPGQPLRQTRFFTMIKKGNPLVFGSGHNLRSMTYIDNLVQALLLVAKSRKAEGQTYWIADSKPYETLEIYSTIADILNVKLKPRHLPSFVSSVCSFIDDVLQALGLYNQEFHVAGEMDKNIACSIKKAQEELGYKPKVDLKEGMKRSIEWCREKGINL